MATILAARNCTTRVPGSGVRQAASTLDAPLTRRRCCPTARCWWQRDLMAALLAARNCTTRPAGAGVPRAASTPHATITRRRCCPTARCWWQGDMMAAAILAARNCTTRPAGPGVPPAASTPHAMHHTATLLPNGKVLVAGGLDNSGVYLSQRGTVRSGQRELECHGQPHTPHATCTRRRCCPTARCWWQGGMVAAALLAARNCTTRASGSWSATGSLTTARFDHTATLLPNGKVLVAGGYDNGSRS